MRARSDSIGGYYIAYQFLYTRARRHESSWKKKIAHLYLRCFFPSPMHPFSVAPVQLSIFNQRYKNKTANSQSISMIKKKFVNWSMRVQIRYFTFLLLRVCVCCIETEEKEKWMLERASVKINRCSSVSPSHKREKLEGDQKLPVTAARAFFPFIFVFHCARAFFPAFLFSSWNKEWRKATVWFTPLEEKIEELESWI